LTQFKNHKATESPNLLVGLNNPDDGGVIQVGDQKIIQTVDFFTPILDNPYDWGRVAAANALSDVYAMGGEPISALQLVCWPRSELKVVLIQCKKQIVLSLEVTVSMTKNQNMVSQSLVL
jgi:selenophosphate synthase